MFSYGKTDKKVQQLETTIRSRVDAIKRAIADPHTPKEEVERLRLVLKRMQERSMDEFRQILDDGNGESVG